MRLHLIMAVPGHPEWTVGDEVTVSPAEGRDILGRGEAWELPPEPAPAAERAMATPTEPRSDPPTRPARTRKAAKPKPPASPAK